MQNDPHLALQARYAEALERFTKTEDEGALLSAYDVACAALDQGLSISRLYDFHRATSAGVRKPVAKALGDQFFQSALAAYDMALQGCRKTVTRLSTEVEDRKESAKTLREAGVDLTRQVDGLRNQLAQASEEQSAFTYAISHDLMSPLTTLRSLLETHADDPDDSEALAGARATAERMQRIVEDIQAYSLAVALSGPSTPVDLGALMGEVLAELDDDITASDAQIRVDPLPRVKGNGAQLRLVFKALLSNALKFREAGHAPIITVSAQDAGPAQKIVLRDNGLGIAEPHLERIFGLFQRLHTYEAYPGTGLGLTLARRLLGQNSGQIAVDSTLGAGSTFTVSLPKTRHAEA